jgi:8-oxo-dGTP diphosphatase
MMPADRARLAAALVASARQYGARVLINSDEALAHAIHADGVHLTSRQLKLLNSRPGQPLVGASCHTAKELALASQLDFVVLGPVLPTASHPQQPAMGWKEFAQLVDGYPLPVFAIGGLGRDDLEVAWRHGAHGIAAIRGAWREFEST